MLHLWLSLSPLLLFGSSAGHWRKEGGRIEKGVWGRGERGYRSKKSKLLRASKELGAKVKVFGWVWNGISVYGWNKSQRTPDGSVNQKVCAPMKLPCAGSAIPGSVSQPELRARRDSATCPRPPVSRSCSSQSLSNFWATALRENTYFIQVLKQPCKVVSIKVFMQMI